MKKRILSIMLISLMFVFAGSSAFAAWTQPKGYAYNQLTIGYYVTDEKYTTLQLDSDGVVTGFPVDNHKVPSAKFSSTKITYYGEYGITDKLTIYTSIPYDWQRSDDTMRYAAEDGPYGVGDINLGIRHSLIDNIAGTGVLMSFQGEVKIPEAYDCGLITTHLSLGDCQYDATVALLFGRGLGKGYAWLNTGYKFRFENDEFDPATFTPSDQIKISFGGGYAVTSWLSIRGIVDWTRSVGNAKVSPALLALDWPTGGSASNGDYVLIKDTLGLEPHALSVGIDLAFNVSKYLTFMKDTFPNKEIVISYNTEIEGWDPFETENFSRGETFNVAFVFPGEGFFPVNLFSRK